MVEEIDAGRKLVKGINAFMPVDCSFWLRADEEDDWKLHIASESIDGSKSTLDSGYLKVFRVLDELCSPFIDQFQVKLIPATSPWAEAAREVNERYPGPMPTIFRRGRFGGRYVQGAYVYPALARASQAT